MAGEETVYLSADDEIRGQSYVCLSFLTPNKGLLRNKELYFFSKFMEFYNMDYKIRASEGFIMDQFRTVQTFLSDVELRIRNSDNSEDLNVSKKKLSDEIAVVRGDMAKKSGADMETFVKSNLSDFRESSIVESYEKYMMVNRQRLEDEFHKQNNFQTSMHGLKVRGVYSTHAEACARAKILSKNDKYFHVFVADVGQWLPWDPTPDDIQHQEYQQDAQGDKLNELMRSYKENADKRDEFFLEDKNQKVAAANKATRDAKEKQAAERASASASASASDAYVSDARPSPFTPSAEVTGGLFDADSGDFALRRKKELSETNTISHV